MQEETKKAVVKLHKFTNALCAKCKPTPYACCSAIFCKGVAEGLKRLGVPVPAPTGHPELPFMGPNGCVVSPELRPGCSGFVCEEQLCTPEKKQEHDRLEQRAFANADPDMGVLLKAASEVSRHELSKRYGHGF